MWLNFFLFCDLLFRFFVTSVLFLCDLLVGFFVTCLVSYLIFLYDLVLFLCDLLICLFVTSVSILCDVFAFFFAYWGNPALYIPNETKCDCINFADILIFLKIKAVIMWIFQSVITANFTKLVSVKVQCNLAVWRFMSLYNVR